jgi:hypothetical protein
MTDVKIRQRRNSRLHPTAAKKPDSTAKARSGYQDFFALWKDADPDILILKQAKAEYAKLQQSDGSPESITDGHKFIKPHCVYPDV